MVPLHAGFLKYFQQHVLPCCTETLDLTTVMVSVMFSLNTPFVFSIHPYFKTYKSFFLCTYFLSGLSTLLPAMLFGLFLMPPAITSQEDIATEISS